jgi:chemotaxis protein MotC
MKRVLLAAAFLVGTVGFAAADNQPALAPYQMVRSLQVLQDRIADGDHAALPMQNKLLEMIDTRLREAAPTEFDDRRLLAGVHGYLSGRLRMAQVALKPFDAGKLRPELGAFLSLVQGSLVSKEAPADALVLFDRARMLGPGTLVEEAALRRSLSVLTTLGDGPRFNRAAEQYVRRFIRSPYASQFVDALLAGIVTLDGRLDLEGIAETIALMTPEQQSFVYLKLARLSAIDHLHALNAFAAGRAEAVSNGADPRAELYAVAPAVASETVDDMLARLKGIDRSRLSPNDRLLLDAAEAVAASITAQPAGMPANAPAPRIAESVSADEAPDSFRETMTSARAKLEAVDAMLEESTQ